MLRGPCGGRLVSWPVLGLSAQHGLKDHRSGRGCPSVKVEPALSPEVQELPGGSAAVGSSPKRAAPSTPLSQGGQAGPRAGHAGATPAGGPRTRHRHEPLLRTGGAGASRNSANPGEAEGKKLYLHKRRGCLFQEPGEVSQMPNTENNVALDFLKTAKPSETQVSSPSPRVRNYFLLLFLFSSLSIELSSDPST
ncbi:uncharacterized protein [Equus caballus]|uniref:uncharacterized protein isoform X1 n=1 Tax=Equus caballus TaxID=9796 RepID=UPI0038B3A1CE